LQEDCGLKWELTVFPWDFYYHQNLNFFLFQEGLHLFQIQSRIYLLFICQFNSKSTLY